MVFDAIRDAPLHDGPGHNPHLTKTAAGCHVWAGSTYGPCFKHGTVGCCLVAHRSPASQRAFNQPRCERCGHFMSQDRIYEQFCSSCAPIPGTTQERQTDAPAQMQQREGGA